MSHWITSFYQIHKWHQSLTSPLVCLITLYLFADDIRNGWVIYITSSVCWLGRLYNFIVVCWWHICRSSHICVLQSVTCLCAIQSHTVVIVTIFKFVIKLRALYGYSKIYTNIHNILAFIHTYLCTYVYMCVRVLFYLFLRVCHCKTRNIKLNFCICMFVMCNVYMIYAIVYF